MRKNAIRALCALLLAITACSTKEKDAPIVIEKIAIIELSEKLPVTMLEGESKDVTVSGQYVEKIEVTTSDANIVTVSTKDKVFTINAKAAGTATVTVTSGKATKVLGVEVSSKKIAVSRIEFNERVKFPIGKGAKLEYTIYPEDATNKILTWESDNTKVVRVDKEGNIHVLRVPNGKATITAKATDGSEVSASITIWAVNPVRSIQINLGDSFLTEVGHSGKLTAEVEGSDPQFGASDPTLSWTSSNPEIIRVDKNGNFEALKEGEVQILATANDGFGAESQLTLKAFKSVNKLKVENSNDNETLTAKRGTNISLTVSTYYNDKLVETIYNGKSVSSFVNLVFSTRNESENYMAEVGRDGLLKLHKKGTFTLRISYSNSLERNTYIDKEIKVTVTD